MNEENLPIENFTDQMLLQVLQTTKDATAIYINEDLLIRFANDAMLSFWGKDSSSIGKTLEEAVPELVGQPFIHILQTVWRSGITYSARETAADLVIDGELKTLYFDFEYRAIQDASKKTYCILHTATDVTYRRNSMLLLAEKEEEEQSLTEEMAATVEEMLSTNEELNQSLILLADSREYIRTIIEQAPVGMCVLQGPDLVIEIANPVILKIWGRTESDVLGKPHRIARPEMKGQQINAWLEDVLESGIAKKNVALRVLLNIDGNLREAFVNSIYQPIISAAGEVTGVLVILEEITQQIRIQREHDKAKQMLELAIEAGGMGTFFYEPSTNLFAGNNLLKEWFGLRPDEYIDLSNATSAIVPEDRERVTQAIAAVLRPESEGHYFCEYRIQPKNQYEPRMLRAVGRTTFDESGIALSLNGTVQDITEQKKDEQRKDDFISMVSHELKTPLTSLKAYMQLLQRIAVKSQDDMLENTLQKALKQIGSMTSMINGFLNVSRLESGKLSIHPLEFDLSDLFHELEAEIVSTSNTHELNFVYNEQLNVSADREKISQILQNLIGNAIKYSPFGSKIDITYHLEENQVVVSVKDNGMGIAIEDQEHLFERYYRVKNNETGSIAGFGIGLYLCKEIIERHQGKIWLESVWGDGATFQFSLPRFDQ
ncbi:ATP-binding protein [Pedobacter sp. AW1-32]|uniref:ATP-binding protein n=1 Tax=Pedobacter sp. AW1-32 TaxID=3383026 RepID=UPI003FEFFA75